MKKHILLLLLAVSFFQLLTAQGEQEWKNKIAPSLLSKARDGQNVNFLVLLNQQADLTAAKQLATKNEKANFVFQQLKTFTAKNQSGLTAFLKKENAAFESLFIVNAITAEGNLDLIQQIAQRADVAKVLDNSIIHVQEPIDWRADEDSHSRSAIEWGLDRINADDVWALGFTGQGTVVGGEDTGYDWSHPALIRQYRGYNAQDSTVDHNYNWHDAIHMISPLSHDSINPCGLNSPVPCDDYGHGTHTMGTMVGLDGDNQVGVAPGAKWCGCRNMERGNGSPFTYLECFQWFLAPTDLNNENPNPDLAPHVINNSWGCPPSEGCDSTNWNILDEAIDHLRMAGTVVVVSAGNAGSGCGTVQDPPAIFEKSFSVGATAINDTIANFSSRGPVIVDGSNRTKPNVSAPGVFVRSTGPGGTYYFSSGTSMAGPHVAGAVALIISAVPQLAGQVEVIEHLLESTAVPKTTDQMCGDIPGSEIPNNTYGYGRIDVFAAVEAAQALVSGIADQANDLHYGVYPNPVSDQLIIEPITAFGKLEITILDMQGRMVIQHQVEADHYAPVKINVSSFLPGMYVYQLRNSSGIQVGKVIKQ